MLKEIAFVLLSLAVIAAAYAGTPDSAALRTVAVLAATTGLAMHVRLARGRWRALSYTAAAAAVLTVVGAAPQLLVAALVMGLVGAELVAPCASRTCVLQAGVWTAVVGALSRVCLQIALPSQRAADLAIETMASSAAGLLAASAVLAVGPFAESVFGHTTRLTMNELLDFDHPLLRQLMTAAPGTFQHSVNVGVLADAAAKAIHADALAARVGGLYHDVGKMRAPAFFVENQDGVNPHATLDPRESARILRAHVSDGVDLVRARRLGERIADFVREHHGTGVMRLFEAKGAALARGDEPDGAYRYTGPRPRSRETAIVMIADQLEATARAVPLLDDAARLDLVRKTVARIREEHQLEESGLSDADVEAIETGLVRALRAMHHHRMTYPDAGPQTPRPSPPAGVKQALRPRRAG